ncbi:MAG TPA: amylo-alpha-1,6-glucosidase [Verrucomicrobiae bacterium]|jgi:predicted glycogen debranching enzyme|nr:amylo-alpha-1,6-glucosidase [Verrucomicrobiae bacterium]
MLENRVIDIPWKAGGDAQALLQREWLVTNGLGGYASGTVHGASTRRYHGLLVPNLPSPRGRTSLVPQFEESAEAGKDRVVFSCGENRDGQSESQAAACLKSFRLEWRLPVWQFEWKGRLFEKRLLMPHGMSTVYVEYRMIEGEPVRLHLRPYFGMRSHEKLSEAAVWPFTFVIKQGRHEIHAEPHAGFELKMGLGPDAIFCSKEKKNHFFYRVEKERGLPDGEFLFSPGYFRGTLEPGRHLVFFASTEPWEYLEADFDKIQESELARLRKLLQAAPEPMQSGMAAELVLAADQFIILPGNRVRENMLIKASGEHVRTVIAGYHWFTDWGRDTMISLEGLCLCTGRFDEAKAILRTFANYIRDGLLPNHFPEGDNQAVYNTVDATFWYFHALERYLQYVHDPQTLEILFPVLRAVIEKHIQGTAYGIGMDKEDGLIRGSIDHYALTWMDAKVDDWVVTPRRGKPVEIQALWYNALRLMEEWSAVCEPSCGGFFADLAARVHESFHKRFWYAEGRYLYDLVDGEKGDDAKLRPNQIFTLSLRHPLLKKDYGPAVLESVRDKLFTPFGLRTLAPGDPEYQPHYRGDRRARDAAYHQGSVWPWLIGHYLSAWHAVHGDKEAFQVFQDAMQRHLADDGIGSISEVFDAEAPFEAGGCIAQAWSVAEALRLMYAQRVARKARDEARQKAAV